MQTSMTLRFRIFGTKKRLSSDKFYFTLNIIALIGFFGVLIGMVRFLTLASQFGAIETEFPILSSPVHDVSYHRFSERPAKRITEYTTMIVLTPEAFFFGDVRGFSTDLPDARKRFEIPHVDGEPQLGSTIQWIRKWQKERSDKLGIRADNLAILVPSNQIPMAIVIQVLEQLKRERLFDRVILGAGIL